MDARAHDDALAVDAWSAAEALRVLREQLDDCTETHFVPNGAASDYQ